MSERAFLLIIIVGILFFITPFVLAQFLMFKEGDERYRIIKEKTSSTTLLFSMGVLFYNAGKEVLNAWKGSEQIRQSLGPTFTLCLISIFFCLSFLYYRRRYS